MPARCGAGISVAYGAAGAHLVQKPAMNKTEIVSSYAGDLWRVKRRAKDAAHLGPGFETEAAFRRMNTLAFTGE